MFSWLRLLTTLYLNAPPRTNPEITADKMLKQSYDDTTDSKTDKQEYRAGPRQTFQNEGAQATPFPG